MHIIVLTYILLTLIIQGVLRKYNTTFTKYQQPSEQFHVTEEMPASLAKCPNESAQSQYLQCQPFA